MQAAAKSASHSLYWNSQGEICCAKHTPYYGSDTWRNEQWTEMSDQAKEDWFEEVGKSAKCECCK